VYNFWCVCLVPPTVLLCWVQFLSGRELAASVAWGEGMGPEGDEGGKQAKKEQAPGQFGRIQFRLPASHPSILAHSMETLLTLSELSVSGKLWETVGDWESVGNCSQLQPVAGVVGWVSLGVTRKRPPFCPAE
jgi:hypothetical protein